MQSPLRADAARMTAVLVHLQCANRASGRRHGRRQAHCNGFLNRSQCACRKHNSNVRVQPQCARKMLSVPDTEAQENVQTMFAVAVCVVDNAAYLSTCQR